MDILEDLDGWRANFQDTWLKQLRTDGTIDWSLYRHPRNRSCPAGPAADLPRSRLLLVTSSGAYLKDLQAPFDTDNPEGDYSFRTFPTGTKAENLDYAHGHYDEAFIRADMQVGIPLGHLQRFVTEGRVGALTRSVVSIMGYQPDSARVALELAPRILALAQGEGANAALFAPL